MRSSLLTRTLVSAVTVVGIAAGSLATAGTSVAASEPVAKPAAVSGDVSTLAVNNFGLNATQAKKVQAWLKKYHGYRGSLDGKLAGSSWKSFQKPLKRYWGYSGALDGKPGKNTVKALQRMLKKGYGYRGAIDGIAGSGTKAAFKRFADKAPSAKPNGLR
ncbi:peptidoglycan-binding protein [Streptomyces sp. NPDC059010]|uniref:peptidoglycan-binding domain-containing protein n=1 Tax=Streptomyces sp. NPDC059010 TaxID=3346695 RepID=UPI0036AD2E1B